MKKQTFIQFLKDQKKKHYSVDLILKHLRDGWEELEREEYSGLVIIKKLYDKIAPDLQKKGLLGDL